MYARFLKHTMHKYICISLYMSSGKTNSHLAFSHYCSQFTACQLWRNCTRSSHMCQNENVSRTARFSEIKDVEKSQKSVKKQTQRHTHTHTCTWIEKRWKNHTTRASRRISKTSLRKQKKKTAENKVTKKKYNNKTYNNKKTLQKQKHLKEKRKLKAEGWKTNNFG